VISRRERRRREEGTQTFRRKYVAVLLRFIKARGCKGNRFCGEKTRTTSRHERTIWTHNNHRSFRMTNRSTHAGYARARRRQQRNSRATVERLFPRGYLNRKEKSNHPSVSIRTKSIAVEVNHYVKCIIKRELINVLHIIQSSI